MSENNTNVVEKSDFGKLKAEYATVRDHVKNAIFNSGANLNNSSQRHIARRSAFNSAISIKKQTDVELEEAKKLSTVDSLTGLLNERVFNLRLAEEVERIGRLGETAMVLYLDVNNLKYINDNQSHEAGDLYLKKVGEVISSITRSTDIVARLHGDEFAVILINTDKHLLNALWEERFKSAFEDNNISIAVGAAQLDANNIKRSIDHADKAMLTAKTLSKIDLVPGQMATKSILAID